MAEPISIQQLKNASEDVKSLEEVVNGDENSVVTTRLGETYPTLSNALNQIDRKLDSADTQIKQGITNLFENGGLPATPFATKALMTASALDDGDFAYVTDDTINNGLYVKTEGAWVKSEYDPLLQSVTYTDKLITQVINGTLEYATITPIDGAAVNNDPINPNLLAPKAGRSYIQIPVFNTDKMIVTNAGDYNWKWVFTDKDKGNISISSYSRNGEFKVPEGAYYAFRTYGVDDVVESPEISIKLDRQSTTVKGVYNSIDEKITERLGSYELENISYEPIEGAAINTGVASGLFAVGEGRKYIKIDVSGKAGYEVIVKNAIVANSWKWVLGTADTRVRIIEHVGSGSFIIPEGGTYLYRTVAGGITEENPDMTIEIRKPTPTIIELDEKIKEKRDLATPNVFGGSALEARMVKQFNSGDMIKISSFTGATQHEQIDNAIAFIKRRGYGILDMESGTWIRDSAILVPSNCWIYLNEATIQLADRVFDNVIRNDGIVPNPDPFGLALELNPNENIRVFGNGIGASAIKGSEVTYSAPHPVTGGEPIPYIGDAYGWRTMLVYLVNVTDYKLHDFRLGNTKCWAVSQEHGNRNFEVYNIDVQSWGIKNGDGIDVRLGCSNGLIYNITGSTGDDLVALTALGTVTHKSYPNGRYLYPMGIGGTADAGTGAGIDITNIDIHSINGHGQHNGVRLLCGNASKLHNVNVDNVTGSFGGSLVLVDSSYGTLAPMGAFHNIYVNGVHSINSREALKLGGNIKDAIFNDITQANAAKALVVDAATKDNVTITNDRRV